MKLKPLAATGLIICAGVAAAQQPGISDNVVKIGLILDMSGIYADITGIGSVNAAKMAIEDFGGKVAGKPIELVYADHQNKPDIAAARAREWLAALRTISAGSTMCASPVRPTKPPPARAPRCRRRRSTAQRPAQR